MSKRQIKRWKFIKSRVVFNHRWYKVKKYSFEIAPGHIIDDYFLGIFREAVYIAAFTKKNELILVRQYKAGIDDITLEVPAGYIERGESPLQAAKRELLEETGYRARSWKRIGKFYSNPTKMRGGFLYFFLAENAHRVAEQNLDLTENIEVQLLPKRD